MAVIAAGTPAPSFTLARADGESFTEQDLQGRTDVLVFYPFAFSPVCTDQLQLYEALRRRAGRARRRRCTASRATPAGRRAPSRRSSASAASSSRTSSPRAPRAPPSACCTQGGFPQRALVDHRPRRGRALELPGASPGELPGVDLLREGLARRLTRRGRLTRPTAPARAAARGGPAPSAKLRPFGK